MYCVIINQPARDTSRGSRYTSPCSSIEGGGVVMVDDEEEDDDEDDADADDDDDAAAVVCELLVMSLAQGHRSL